MFVLNPFVYSRDIEHLDAQIYTGKLPVTFPTFLSMHSTFCCNSKLHSPEAWKAITNVKYHSNAAIQTFHWSLEWDMAQSTLSVATIWSA